ncbi:DALR anticodon-binding domain-containing protein 3 [Anopheles nili]|uniref:DALR anticodon-binding domain-containing protein 3 n=1 Tax=Anopheles nili TaxID=185578 RepID=UPI00237B64BF|nr:DALR anticodon-binding domain-containing protein 3 [Anopheles nili]
MEGVLLATEKLLLDYLSTAGCSPAITFLDKNLCKMGDVIVKSKTDTAIQFNDQALIAASKSWPFPVTMIRFNGNAAHIWFDRIEVFRMALDGTGMDWHLPATRRSSSTAKISVEDQTTKAMDLTTLTEFRMDILRVVIKNCFVHAGYTMIGKEEIALQQDARHVKIVQKRSKIPDEQHVEVLCGPVLSGESMQNASQYIQQRSNDMQLIAQHRYGLRIANNTKLEQLVASLGRSAAIVDMLHTKQTSAIDMRNQHDTTRTQTSSKGAAFILYNYARLASIFKKHARLVDQKVLSEVPPANEINFSLLVEPDEWHLLYVYLIRFPRILEKTLGHGEFARIAPYHLLDFTLSLVKCVSKYYCRIRILTENRPKLEPVMFARLHLLRTIFKLLELLLKLLDMETVEEM